MVIEAQKLKLKYGKQDQKFLVENFSEIGKSWKMDGSVGNAQKINKIVHGTFDSSQGYEYYIEKRYNDFWGLYVDKAGLNREKGETRGRGETVRRPDKGRF